MRQLKWMTVDERHEYFLSITAFKALHHLAPPYISNEFTFRKDIGLRTSEKTKLDVFLPSFTSTVKDKSVLTRSAKIWNNLPLSVKSSETLERFKFAYKQHVLGG